VKNAGTWDVIVVRHMVPSHEGITNFENLLQSVAERWGGQKDGWGCTYKSGSWPQKIVLLKGSLKKIGPSSVQPCALFSEQLDLVEVSGSQLTWAAWEPLR
jgi:hypothetical protein